MYNIEIKIFISSLVLLSKKRNYCMMKSMNLRNRASGIFSANSYKKFIFILLIFNSLLSYSQVGIDCSDPLEITEWPFEYIGTTCGMVNDYSTICATGNLSAEDMVWIYNSSYNQCIYFNVDATGIYNIFITNDCESDCVVTINSDNQGNITDELVTLEEGTTYYFIYDAVVGGSTPSCNDVELYIANYNSDGVMSNDMCECVLPLIGNASNYGASATDEPSSWAPENNNNIDCPGGSWQGNQNGVWYTFNNPIQQDVEIIVYNIACEDGGGGGGGNNADQLQMGIWTNSGSCDLDQESFIVW